MSPAELTLAVRAGADIVGLVAEMPSGPGPIADDLIADLARRTPPGVTSFMLTSRQSAGTIIAHHRHTGTAAIQIVDALPQGSYVELRAALRGVKLIQVVHVTGAASVDEALAIAPEVDALLLDSGNPSLAVRELGGTGRRHDWAISLRIREQASIPVFLAGGLRATNVREAIDTVGPFGLDVCSGVRTGGALDPVKVEAFVRAAGRPTPPLSFLLDEATLA
jgi:phosphoribosylanthranilate isomerase